MIKKLYHQILKTVLRMSGLDFSWYQTFYVHCFHAVPGIETCIQRLRSQKAALRFFDGYDIQNAVKEGDVVLDIGANIGVVSSQLLTLGFIVHAYEPDSRCIAFLKRRFSKFDPSRFHLHHCAIGDHEGTVHLNYGHLTTESNSILEDKPGTGDAGGEDVKLYSIQSVLDFHDYVPLIKMDISWPYYTAAESRYSRIFLWLVRAHRHPGPCRNS